MQLLLLLSALLTSLTGAVVGARTPEMQTVQASAGIASSASETPLVARRQVQPSKAPAAQVRTGAHSRWIDDAAPAGRPEGYERLLE